MKKKYNKWLENTYYVGMLASIILIIVQVFNARNSLIRTSEWEKAKITIENIDQFKKNLIGSPLNDIIRLSDRLYADFSTLKGWEQSENLRVAYYSLFDNDTTKMFDDYLIMIDVMDAFAYPIIMGYANELGSYKNVMRQFYTYGTFLIPIAFHNSQKTGLHAKLLYRLWRIRLEIDAVDNVLRVNNEEGYDLFRNSIDCLLYYEGTAISEASTKAYRKKLDKKLNEMQKEIEVFRKNSMK
jgi:hypothetical protein